MFRHCDAKANNLFLITIPFRVMLFLWLLSTHVIRKLFFKGKADFQHLIVTKFKTRMTDSDNCWFISICLIKVLLHQFVSYLTNYLLVSILWLKNATFCSDTKFSNFNKNSSSSPVEVSKSLLSSIFSTVGVGFALPPVDSLI